MRVGAERELAHEHLHPDEREDELNGEGDPKHLEHGGHHFEERGNHRPHSRAARDQSEGSEHPRNSQHTEGQKLRDGICNQDHDADDHDEEVDAIPGRLDVGVLAIAEPKGDNLGHHLQEEEDCEDVVERVQGQMQSGAGVVPWRIQREADGREHDHQEHGTIKRGLRDEPTAEVTNPVLRREAEQRMIRRRGEGEHLRCARPGHGRGLGRALGRALRDHARRLRWAAERRRVADELTRRRPLYPAQR